MTLSDLEQPDGRSVADRADDIALGSALSIDLFGVEGRDAVRAMLKRAVELAKDDVDVQPLMVAACYFVDEERLCFKRGDGLGFRGWEPHHQRELIGRVNLAERLRAERETTRAL